MKDKLRELAKDLAEKEKDYAPFERRFSEELLAIIDAEGDGGAVAWMSPNKERLEFSRPDTVYGSHTIPLYLHPARSGVVSDEDARDAARYRYIRDNNWSGELYPVIMMHKNAIWDSAIDAAIQGERHER